MTLTWKNKLTAGLFLLSTALTGAVFAGEDKITKGYNSMDAMGCMLVRECTKDVEQVHSILDISTEYDNTEEFTPACSRVQSYDHGTESNRCQSISC